MDDWRVVLLVGCSLVCLLPLLITAVLAVIMFRTGQRWLDRLANPDVTRLQHDLQERRAHSPNASTDQLIGQIIHQQAIKGGIVGAITGLGGFITLPIALPIDILVSLRIQAALVNFIAGVYHPEADTELQSRVRTYLVMSGSGQVTEATSRVAARLLVRIAGKSLAKIVPILGAIVGFMVNYLIVQAIGRLTLRWYRDKPAG